MPTLEEVAQFVKQSDIPESVRGNMMNLVVMSELTSQNLIGLTHKAVFAATIHDYNTARTLVEFVSMYVEAVTDSDAKRAETLKKILEGAKGNDD